MNKLRITYKKPLLINTNDRNYPLVTKIYKYHLYYQGTTFSFYNKKALKAFLLEQYKLGCLYKDIESLQLDCEVSKNWIQNPIRSYLSNHFNIEYF